MEHTEKKQLEKEEEFVKSAEEAKLNLKNIEKDIKEKSDGHSRTLANIRSNCNNQFET